MQDYVDYLKQKVKQALSDRTMCHGYDHALHVERIAMKIAKHFPDSNKDIIVATSLLHDVWDHKFVNDPTKLKEEFQVYLKACGFSNADINNIYNSIDDLSWSKEKTPISLEGKIVQDADRISALGAVGILRTATYAADSNRHFDQTVQHIIDKCLLLRNSLNFEISKELSKDSHQFLIDFVRLYREEIIN